jgi:FeS assembly SUF system protein
MSDTNDILQIESNIVKVLKTVYDPEIPVNVYDLGLIYDIDVKENKTAEITMTLTAPNCPVADQVLMEVKTAVEQVKGIEEADVNLVFDPPWDQSMLTDEAKLELGML